MRKASLKLSVGVLTLVAAGVVSGQAAARPETEADGELRLRGVRFFADDSDTTTPVAEAAAPPAAVVAPKPVATPGAPVSGVATVVTPVVTAAAATSPAVESAAHPAVEPASPPAQAPGSAQVAPMVMTARLTEAQALQAERDRLNGKDNPASPQTSEPPLPDDGLGEDGAFITADEVTSPEENIMLARGKVEMRWEGRLIRADEVRYDQSTGKTVASGHVQTINPDGSVQYADRLEVDNEHAAGTGERIAYIDTENTKLFANKVERIDEQTNRLSEVIFTPCELCVKNNVTQEPTWHIQAGSITQDKKRRVVIYRNAIIKAKGIPVFYMPILWHADVTAKRSSGFLMPKPGYSQRRGATLEVPYLWAVSPYTDIIISPEFSSNLNPLLNLEVHRKFYSGDLHTRFGVTNERFFDNKGRKWGESDNRGYMLLDGKFDINEDWRWNFTAQRVWDKTGPGLLSWSGPDAAPISQAIAVDQPISNFYERYKIHEGFPYAGDFSSNSRRLISQINLVRQTDTAFFSASLISFQSLALVQPGYRISPDLATSPMLYLAERDRTQPAVAPMIDAYWSPDQEILGGRLTLSANAVSIIRKARPSFDIFPIEDLVTRDASGNIVQDNRGPVDTARANIGLSWRRDMITPGGVKIAPFLEARQDEYWLRDYYAASYPIPTGQKDSRRVSRSLGTVGLDVSYPLLRKFSGLTMVIEPIAQLALSPDSQIEPFLTNEDSNTFEVDATTLFKVNRSPGFDLYEGGKRLNMGLKTQLSYDSGLRVSTLLGRGFRQNPEENFYRTYRVGNRTYKYDSSSLAETKSDWVVQAEVDTGKGLRLYTRQRIGDDGSVRRSESGASYFSASTQLTIRHQYDKTGPVFLDDGRIDATEKYHDLQLFGQHFFTSNWGVSGQISRDMLRERWLRSEASIIYKDDCARFELVYQRDETALLQTIPGKASESISVRISLATLAPSDDDFVNVR